jgi:hypothetical protein
LLFLQQDKTVKKKKRVKEKRGAKEKRINKKVSTKRGERASCFITAS